MSAEHRLGPRAHRAVASGFVLAVRTHEERAELGHRPTVQRAVRAARDEDSELLELRVIGGLASRPVAKILGKRAGAMRMAQSRALGRLEALLSEAAV
ncbi:MAG: hypothetical protein M3R46_11160 [Actinomycetota bacterium]|nr:hypothetical protein [Actinomycetota bacterium]